MRLVDGCIRVEEPSSGDGESAAGRFRSVSALLDALDGIAADHDVTVQAFDARYVVSRRHLERAVELADRERDRGEAIVRDRGVEILLYAAGRRQIDRALTMGVGEETTGAVVLVNDPDSDDGSDAEAVAADAVAGLLEPDDVLGTYDPGCVREFFGIEERELAATAGGLEPLVLERVALLVVDR